MIVWSHLTGLENAFDGNCFEFFLSKGNTIAYFAGKYQLFGEHYRLFSHSFTLMSKNVLESKMCFNSNTV